MEKKTFLNSNKAVIAYFVKLVHRLAPKYIPALILGSVFSTLRPLLFIFGPKLIVDELVGLKRTEYLVVLIAGIAIGNFLLTSAEKWFEFKTHFHTDEFNNAFERHISKKTAEIDYHHIEDPDTLNLKERALFAVRNHWLMGSMIIAMAKVINQGILLLSLIAIIWTFSPWILTLLIGIVVVNSLLFKKIQGYYYIESTETIGANRSFVYFIGQSSDLEIAKDVRLYQMSDLILSKMNTSNLTIYNLYLRLYGAISRLNGWVSVNVQIQTVATYLLLAKKAIMGTVTLGNFMMYAGSIGKLGTSMNEFVSGIIEVNRLCRQLELLVEYEKIQPSNEQGVIKISDECGYEIRFENVSFKYPRADNYTLKNINVTIRKGEKVSIIGKNGAGKTTFVKLLTRLYKPTEGVITLDGIDIQTLSYEEYMSKIAAVFQDYRLFGVSIEENITGQEGGDIQKVSQVLCEVGIDEDVSKLPLGIQTTLSKGYDKDATKLSGGQAQKIAIGRALYKQAEIVVLDEPTAALDPLAEHDVYLRFNELVQGKTAIYISHRLSSCRFCDRILVFDSGHVIQEGTHEELICIKDSAYAELFNAQAEYYTA